MELNRIILNNFRQYYGENIIEFASGNKNITLILGENNAGKTGIYRGLMFALYGDKVLGQDSGKNADIKLVNMNYLEETTGLGEASVCVEFTENSQKYILTRTIKAAIFNNEYKQNKEDDVYLDTIKNGEYYKNIIVGRDRIQSFVEDILDSNIKEFFFFDGEHIKTLAGSDKVAQKEVKKGIIKLMDIDKFEKTKDLIDSLIKKEQKIITEKASNNKIQELSDKKDSVNSEIDNKILEKNTILDNLDSMELEITTLENDLEKSQNLNEIYSQRREKESEIVRIDEFINEKRNILNTYHFPQLPLIFLTDYLNKIKYKLEENLTDSSDNIPIHLIENAIKTKKCQCCNQDIITDETRYYLEKLKENFTPKKTTNISNIMINDIRKNMGCEKDNVAKIKELLIDIEEKERIKIDLNRDIQNLSVKIDSRSETELVLKSKTLNLNKLKMDVTRYKNKITTLEEDIEKLTIEIKEVDLELNKYLKLNSDLDYQIRRLEFMIEVKDTIDMKYNHYIELTRQKLGEETTSIFKKLIDNKDRTLVDKIEIDKNYSMKVMYSNGINVSEDISQGQQLIVALSFVTALAKTASKSNDIIDYPLFMDTPFAKLSRGNRERLICNIPELTRQWIPLFTDTEFTDFEKGIFDSNDKVGKNYLIKKQTDRISSIEVKGDF